MKMHEMSPERLEVIDTLLAGSLLELDPTHAQGFSEKPDPARNLKFVVECEPDKIDTVITFLEKLRDRLKAAP